MNLREKHKNLRFIILLVGVVFIGLFGGCTSKSEKASKTVGEANKSEEVSKVVEDAGENSNQQITKSVEKQSETKNTENKVSPEVSKDPSQEDEKADEKENQKVTIYVPDEEYLNLIPKEVQAIRSPQGLIDALMKEKVLPAGVKVNSFAIYNKDGEDITKDYETLVKEAKDSDKLKNLTATIDLSKEFVDAITNTGTCGECVGIYGVVDTFLSNYQLESVRLISEGKEIEPNHLIMDEPFDFQTDL